MDWRKFAVVLLAVAAGCRRPEPSGIIAVSGRIEGDVTEIGSKVAGRIVEITAREGDSVKAGQVLVRLDDQQAKARLAEAQAHLVVVQRQRERARLQIPVLQEQLRQNRLRSQQADVESHGRVAQAEAQVAQARAQLLQATADLEQNRADAERYRNLAERGSVPRQQAEQYATRAKISQALVEAVSKQVEAAEGALRTARSTLTNPEIYNSATEAVERQLVQARAEVAALGSEVAAAQAQLERARADVEDLTIRSPIDATVITRAAEPGKVTPAGATILTIVNLEGVYLRAFVPEGRIGKVRLGQPAEVILDSDPTSPLEAVVSRIDPQAMFTPENTYFKEDRVKQVVGVKLRIKNPAGRAKPGMPADGRIRTDAA